MSKAGPGLSISDLQSAAKKLNTVDEPADRKPAKADASERSAIEALEDLYDKHDGDLDRIFGELKADPSKAKKPHHRPKNAKEFATKYLEGYYSLVSDTDVAEAKSHHK
eukprot:gene36710-44532_t